MNAKHERSVADEVENLRQMEVPALVDRYREEFGREPRIKQHQHLWRKISWKVQEKRFGGLSIAAKAKLEELIASLDIRPDSTARTAVRKLRSRQRDDALLVGSSLTREYKGRQIVVRVIDGGFEHGGVVHKSLSAVAKFITGQHCSGVAWMGLRPRKVAR